MTFKEDIAEIRESLNDMSHAVTRNETDIGWLKKMTWWQLGIGASSFLLLLGILAKILLL